MQTLEKYYAVDLGLVDTVLGRPSNADLGHRLENVVYLELLSRYGKVWVGKNYEKEIDFVVKNSDGITEYFQVSQSVIDRDTLKREAGAFENTGDNYRRTLLTLDMFDTDEYELKMQAAVEHFEHELAKIRTGRAHPGMLDGIKVVAYGTEMPLNQVANVTAPEAQLLQITPFDPSNIQAIAASIRNDQGLGLNPSDDGRVVRVPVPPLTEDRRRQLARQAGEKVEEARIALRNVRQDGLKDARAKKEAKELSEDDVKLVEKEFDRLMQEAQGKLDEAFKAKEKDILTI